jgi:hypothetical protein
MYINWKYYTGIVKTALLKLEADLKEVLGFAEECMTEIEAAGLTGNAADHVAAVLHGITAVITPITAATEAAATAVPDATAPAMTAATAVALAVKIAANAPGLIKTVETAAEPLVSEVQDLMRKGAGFDARH